MASAGDGVAVGAVQFEYGRGTALFVMLWTRCCWRGRLAPCFTWDGGADWRAGLLCWRSCLTPQFLLYQGIVWKDVLFADGRNCRIRRPGALRSAAARGDLALAAFALLLSLAAADAADGDRAAAGGRGCARLGPAAAKPSCPCGKPGGLLVATLLAGGNGHLGPDMSAVTAAMAPSAEFVWAQTYDMIGALKASPGLKLDLMDRQDPDFKFDARRRECGFTRPRDGAPAA